jgi:hypothetical protein
MITKDEILDLESVRNFWQWFSFNQNDFGQAFENVELLHDLDQQISKLGNFSWEIGPGENKDNQLVISPNGDADLLTASTAIIALAPELDKWEFYYAKPPKHWNLVFEFITEQNEEIVIDASKWTYVLLKYPDCTFEVIIRLPEYKMLNEDERIIAAEIFLDSVLGEETRIKLINRIEVVAKFSEEFEGKECTNINPLISLRESNKSSSVSKL